MNPSTRIKVAVVRGGEPHQYERSLKSGAHVLSLLRQMDARYDPLDIFISRDGEWHHHGIAQSPESALGEVKVVWNTTHGVEEILESLGRPFVGSSKSEVDKVLDREVLKNFYNTHSLLTPRHTLVFETHTDEDLIRIFRNYLPPFVIRSASSPSLGTRIVRSFGELKDAVKEFFTKSPKVVVEEIVVGQTISCGVVENARGVDLYALIPTPAVDRQSHDVIEDMAKKAHRVLGLSHYSESQFVLTKGGKIYVVETHAVPEFHENSALHHSLHAVGWHPRDFVDHSIKLALR